MGVDLVGRVAEAVGIARGQDHVGAASPCEAGGLESDARAPADDDDGLAEQVLVVARVGSEGGTGHGSSRVRAANTALVVAPYTRWADRSSPSVHASYSQIGLYTPAKGRIA